MAACCSTTSSTTPPPTSGANHYVGAAGRRRPKVFKLARRTLTPDRPTTVVRRHRFEHVSIRRLRPGRHTIDIQVNGRILGAVDLDVVDP